MIINKIIVLSKYYFEDNVKNGASSRLNAWKYVYGEMVKFNSINSNLTIKNKDVLIIDFPGAKIPDIIRIWILFRRYNPKFFLQDSQLRFFYTKLLFDFKFCEYNKLIMDIINCLRGAVREISARILFNKVGYVSSVDANYFLNKGSAIQLLESNRYSNKEKSTIKFKKIIGIVGNFNYSPNSDSLQKIFINKDFISALKNNNIKIRILGYESESYIKNILFEYLDIIDIGNSGRFDNLDDVTKDIGIFISPVLYGSGVKNKINEVSNLNKVTLAWEGLREEYPYSQKNIIYFNFNDLPKIIEKLFNNYYGYWSNDIQCCVDFYQFMDFIE